MDFLVSTSVISVALLTEIWTSRAMDGYLITWKWSSWRERQTGRANGSRLKSLMEDGRSHAFQSLPREFCMWTPPQPAPRVRFLCGWFRCYPAFRAGQSLQANQLDAILFLNQNWAYLFNMHHPRVVVESRWWQDGQMSWKLNLHRLASRICLTLSVPETLHPPPPSLSF